MAATPKGPWQQPHPGLTICTRHPGQGAGGDPSMCAYRQGDPDRCDTCHVTWATITERWPDATSRATHTAQHHAQRPPQPRTAANTTGATQ